MRRTKPSVTAIGVARALVAASVYPPVDRIVPAGAAALTRALLASISAMRRFELRRMARPAYPRRLRRREERGPLRGGLKHIALRKRWFDDAAVAAMDDGADQVIVLGAGLDTLAARHAGTRPSVTFLEVDHPATQAVKRRGLEAAGALPPNLHLVPLDLTRADLTDTLSRCPAYRPGARALIVAEGLLMYLPPEEVAAILRFVAEETAPGSRIAFSFIEREPDGRFRITRGRWLLRPMLALIGEPFRWGIAAGGLGDFLGERGLESLERVDDDELLRRYLPGHEDATCLGWELLAIARSPA